MALIFEQEQAESTPRFRDGDTRFVWDFGTILESTEIEPLHLS
jgi:hypothetical protein